MADIYNNGQYLARNPDWGAADAPFKLKYIRLLLDRNNIRFGSVSDIGCGSGELLVQLEKAFPELQQLTGFDVSGDALQLARTRVSSKIRFEKRDIVSHPLPGQNDLLLLMDVLEHVENYFALLRALRGRSRHILFHIPLDMCVLTLFREGKLIEERKRIGHIHVFTERFILSLLEDYGFRLLDRCYTPPSFAHKTLRERSLQVFRRFLYFLHPRLASRLMGGYSLMILAQND